jgi:ADP-ribosylglycohydrolase
MIGAIAGDVIGSPHEGYRVETKGFPLFDRQCRFTDDTVLTVAVADVLLNGGTYADRYQDYYRRYPNAGYGSNFRRWAESRDPEPYGSFGNGSAMRVSPVGFALDSLDEVLAEAKRSAEPTHNHPEGIKGARAIATAVFLARIKTAKPEIRSYLERTFEYDLRPSVDAMRKSYRFDVTCQVTVPAALTCFLESTDFEDAVRNAVSLGGDTDTLACMAGSVAQAYYEVPAAIEREALSRLDSALLEITHQFTARFVGRR